jgi:flagellar M-ring protein FliF
MVDRLKEIPKKLLEWWNKFSPKQKTIIVCAVAGIALAIGILSYALTRPQYTVIANCETSKEASEITDLLDSNGYKYQISTDATTVSVLTEDVSEVNLLLGANDITAASFTISDVTDGGFSTTESDKQKRYVYYKEQNIESDLESNELIEKAHVTLTIPENDGTLINQNTASSASVVLELKGELDSSVPTSLAHYIAAALGNSNTDNITIIDSDGNLLFSGETQAEGTGSVTTQLAMKQEAESLVKQEVKSVLLGTNLYDNVEVASNLSLDFSTYKVTEHKYDAPDGQTQGVLASEDLYTAENYDGVSGEPGTGSNDEDGTTYTIDTDSNSTSTVTEESRNYLPYETLTEQSTPAGQIQYDSSSISITAKKLRLYKEEEVESQGLLVDMTWDEFKAANADQVKLDVDDDLYSVVQTATGISSENISIIAYEVPVFLDDEGSGIQASDIVQILLIIAILGVLAFVVIRSMRSQKEEQPEEELAVENLLQSVPEEPMEDIEIESKSEARKLIDKFVDENPEAAANLLRNWLSEEWG